MGDQQNAENRELDQIGELAEHMESRGNVPGAPTWPTPSANIHEPPASPPVGMNWRVVADHLGMDHRLLEHSGSIVLAGEYFPEAGYFLDPATLEAQYVDVGQVSLRRGYFLGKLPTSSFNGSFRLRSRQQSVDHPIVRRDTAPVIGLFFDRTAAERARSRLVRGSLASGISLEEGPLGIELRIQRASLPGRVATVLASEGGAVISIGGEAVRAQSGAGAMATGRSDAFGDARRGGTGAMSDSPGSEPADDAFMRVNEPN